MALIAEAMAKSYKDIVDEVNTDGEAALDKGQGAFTAGHSGGSGSTTVANNTAMAPTPATHKARGYWLRKVSGSGCPYAASWMAHINLYKKLTWRIDNTKVGRDRPIVHYSIPPADDNSG